MRSMHAAPAPAHPHTCLGRTWNLVNDKSLDRVITWSKDGRSFIVKQPSILSTYLPKTLGLFKATFPSFLCEMNIYNGFRCVASDENGTPVEFALPGFERGKPDLLNTVRRVGNYGRSRRMCSRA
mmetsp:Transcript_4522/g.11154  ORF Transcript_4522/g.11154 Transcript_4522/m.11154 type:complete len:125 (-) Transcript_4522:513-887(-)